MARPPAVAADFPNGGIDVGTKAEVHRILDELAADGMAVLMISSELPEVLGMADRILVLHEGRLTGEFDSDEADEERDRASEPPARPAAGRRHERAEGRGGAWTERSDRGKRERSEGRHRP